MPKESQNGYDLPAITCTTQNNGISCYVPKANATIFKNCISVAANGDAPAFYQPHDFTILQDAYVLKFKGEELSHLHYLYLVALLQKILAKFVWTNKSGWEKVKLEKILLPVLPSLRTSEASAAIHRNNIDCHESANADSRNDEFLINQHNQIAFDFMEIFISAVQKEVIKSVVLWRQKHIDTTKVCITTNKAIIKNH